MALALRGERRLCVASAANLQRDLVHTVRQRFGIGREKRQVFGANHLQQRFAHAGRFLRLPLAVDPGRIIERDRPAFDDRRSLAADALRLRGDRQLCELAIEREVGERWQAAKKKARAANVRTRDDEQACVTRYEDRKSVWWG